MINTANKFRLLTLSITACALVFLAGNLAELNAQTRDPFAKPGWARTREPGSGSVGVSGKVSGPAVNLGAPGIQQRIEYFKRIRESAAASGQPLPKVTSVLTLDEMAVTGIFRTPRGYAAMVEATPIKLSYTIYPGEKFFDGQLVAVEENRLVFRRVTKSSNGKFVSSVENKPLRQYTEQQVVQGTAPVEPTASAMPTAEIQPAPANEKISMGPIVSPLEEMNKQADNPAKEKGKKAAKPVKVARSK